MAQIIRDMEGGREAVDRTNHAFAEISRNAEDTRGKAHDISELTQQQIAGTMTRVFEFLLFHRPRYGTPQRVTLQHLMVGAFIDTDCPETPLCLAALRISDIICVQGH